MADFHFYCAICGKALSASNQDDRSFINCGGCGRSARIPSGQIAFDFRDEPATTRIEVVALELKILCPGCDSRLGVDLRFSGRASECPRCHIALTIPPLHERDLLRLAGDSAPEQEPTRPGSLSEAEIQFLTGPMGGELSRPSFT